MHGGDLWFMKISLERVELLDEVEVNIRYSTQIKEMERIMSLLKSINTRIKCSNNGSDKYISISDVYYFESVDKMTFAYCEHEVYRTDLRLYQIIEQFAHLGMVQISKSCVLNINTLESIAPLFNSRMEALLINNERVFVTRRYLENLKHALQEVMSA